MSIPPPGSRASKVLDTFRTEYGITAHVRAPAERVWALLTDAAKFPSWNTTVTSIEGEIKLGSAIKVRVPSSERTFNLVVTQLAPPTMVWSSGSAPLLKGKRTFTVVPLADGSSEFSMVEVMSGLMLPLIKGSLPNFAPIFERYAIDLQRAAENVTPSSS